MQLIVKNLNEDIVFEVITDMKKANPDNCFCAICVTDIAMLALNKLPPQYVASKTTKTFFNPSFNMDREKEKARPVVEAAAQQVYGSPRH